MGDVTFSGWLARMDRATKNHIDELALLKVADVVRPFNETHIFYLGNNVILDDKLAEIQTDLDSECLECIPAPYHDVTYITQHADGDWEAARGIKLTIGLGLRNGEIEPAEKVYNDIFKDRKKGDYRGELWEGGMETSPAKEVWIILTYYSNTPEIPIELMISHHGVDPETENIRIVTLSSIFENKIRKIYEHNHWSMRDLRERMVKLREHKDAPTFIQDATKALAEAQELDGGAMTAEEYLKTARDMTDYILGDGGADAIAKNFLSLSAFISHPMNYHVQVTPKLTPKEERKAAKGKYYNPQKRRHVLIVDHEVLIQMREGDVDLHMGTHASPVPHHRRGHWKQLPPRDR